MFDSQIQSLASLTFLVQLIGILLVVSYRLKGLPNKLNEIGLVFGLLVLSASTLSCIAVDAGSGLSQGVTLVLVAVFATFDFGVRSETSTI